MSLKLLSVEHVGQPTPVKVETPVWLL
ncbi:rCG35248 [Rattus norvegicus]|uniref:RCG35248 n=1 Tax=Rattus norvegicus TaxID=10116 RepID=A6HD31_RAT|nr:rCG35248 [Rattus norvegicus]